jgi:hypothetical protein
MPFFFFFFWSSQKSLGTKSGEQGGCSISAFEFGAETAWQRAPCEIENCRGGESNRWDKVQAFLRAQFQVTASIIIHTSNKLVWPCRANSKWKLPLISKKVMSIVFICGFNMRTCLGGGDVGRFHCKRSTFSKLLPHKPRKALHKCHLHYFLISHKI